MCEARERCGASSRPPRGARAPLRTSSAARVVGRWHASSSFPKARSTSSTLALSTSCGAWSAIATVSEGERLCGRDTRHAPPCVDETTTRC